MISVVFGLWNSALPSPSTTNSADIHARLPTRASRPSSTKAAATTAMPIVPYHRHGRLSYSQPLIGRHRHHHQGHDEVDQPDLSSG